MSRTNPLGLPLKRFLEFKLNRDLSVPEFYTSWGGSHSKYYANRHEADDFPNPLELWNVAETFPELNFLNLLVEFGLAPATPQYPGYTVGTLKGTKPHRKPSN